MKFRAYQSPLYRVYTKAMVISKGSYGYGELKHELPLSVEKQYLSVPSYKLPRFMGGSIGTEMKRCETTGVPIGMVQRFHKRIVDIKRKLRVWRAQKCIALVGAETLLIRVGPQTTQIDGGQYMAKNGNMRNFGPTNPHCTAFTPKQWLSEKEATGMESSKMYCPSRCRNSNYECGASKHSVS